MIKYILLILFVLSGCANDPPCPPIKKEDWGGGIYSRKLGYVKIDNELCQIFEQYTKPNCSQHLGRTCDGDVVECAENTLTRVTKCPSGLANNTITYSQDKFHREQIQ